MESETTIPAPETTAEAPATKTKPRRGFWRTNLEAFTVAIVMALVIKAYAFEAFQVPTESMEPTIIGRTPGGDRIIVNKFAYQLHEPERYEVVVFRYPLSRLVNYVKRLVGMPGETVRIAHGDIFAAAFGTEDFVVTRKPAAVQEAIFHANPVIPEEVIEEPRPGTFWEWWQRPQSRTTLDSSEGRLTLEAGDAPLTIATRQDLTPVRRDADAGTRSGRQDQNITDPAGDLRLEIRVTPEDASGPLIMEITDGTQASMPIRLEVTVSGGPGTSQLRHGENEVGGPTLAEFRLAPGKEVELILENVDDQVRVLVDGEELCRYQYRQALLPTPAGRSRVSFGLGGGRAVFTQVGLYRDIYYTVYPGSPDTFAVPAGHYLFFGDNSPNSLDARGWKVVGIRQRADGRVLLGDMEAVSDDFNAPRQDNNPFFEMENKARIQDEDIHHFVDIQGNHLRLEPGSYDILDLTRFPNLDGVGLLELHQSLRPEPAPEEIAHAAVDTSQLKQLTIHTPHAFEQFCVLVHYVARKDIMGQANLVFWPPQRMGIIR